MLSYIDSKNIKEYKNNLSNNADITLISIYSEQVKSYTQQLLPSLGSFTKLASLCLGCEIEPESLKTLLQNLNLLSNTLSELKIPTTHLNYTDLDGLATFVKQSKLTTLEICGTNLSCLDLFKFINEIKNNNLHLICKSSALKDIEVDYLSSFLKTSGGSLKLSVEGRKVAHTPMYHETQSIFYEPPGAEKIYFAKVAQQNYGTCSP